MGVESDRHVPTMPEQAWRDLNYDVGWEATHTGVIRCRAVHNKRNDLFEAVDGINLRTVWCESSHKSAFDLLQEKRTFRHVEIRLPAVLGRERLYLTARVFAGRLFRRNDLRSRPAGRRGH